MEVMWSSRNASTLERQDGKPVIEEPNEVRLFLVVQNEVARLPYLFSYYKNLGVGRFFVVDDRSDDG